MASISLDLLPLTDINRILLTCKDFTCRVGTIILCVIPVIISLMPDHTAKICLVIVAWCNPLASVAGMIGGLRGFRKAISVAGMNRVEDAVGMSQADVVWCYLGYLIIPTTLCAIIVTWYSFTDTARQYHDRT